MAKHKKIIGIIGGMGPQSGTKLQSYIYDFAQKVLKTERDSDYPDVIHLSLPSGIPDRTDFMLGLTEENPADAVFPFVEILSDIGNRQERPVVVCVACNTFHARPIWDAFISDVQKLNNIEILNLIDMTVDFIQKEVSPPSKIAILTTLGAYKEQTYKTQLSPLGYNIYELLPEQQKDVHNAIYDVKYGLKAFSALTDEASRKLNAVVKYLKEQNVDKIILGCTELEMAFQASSDEVFVSPLKIVAQKLVYSSVGQ